MKKAGIDSVNITVVALLQLTLFQSWFSPGSPSLRHVFVRL